jgi:hypothetical protein
MAYFFETPNGLKMYGSRKYEQRVMAGRGY